MAASPIIAPEEELELEKKDLKVCETKSKPKPAGQKRPDRSLLQKIFEGHEEFLGYTPD
ncbi:MAG: hypothetical protein WAN17_19710 [Candidatus Sulfotelmatobacter sp.]